MLERTEHVIKQVIETVRYYFDFLNFLFKLFKLRIDNSGWSVNASALFDVAGMRWYQGKYHALYTIRQLIINSIY